MGSETAEFKHNSGFLVSAMGGDIVILTSDTIQIP